MSHTEQISLKLLSHSVPNPNPECLLCIRIALGKHSSAVLIPHCIVFVVIFLLKEWIRAGSAVVVLDFIKALQTRTIPYIFYTYQSGTCPCIFIGKCKASFSIININPNLYSIVQMNCNWPQEDTQHPSQSIPISSFKGRGQLKSGLSSKWLDWSDVNIL